MKEFFNKRTALIYGMLWFDAKLIFKKWLSGAPGALKGHLFDIAAGIWAVIYAIGSLIIWAGFWLISPLVALGYLSYQFTFRVHKLVYKPTIKAILDENLERFKKTGDWRK